MCTNIQAKEEGLMTKHKSGGKFYDGYACTILLVSTLSLFHQ